MSEPAPVEGTPFDSARFREVMACFPSGVTVVTALNEGVPVGFTCQAFASLSLVPPMVVIAPSKVSTSWPRILSAGSFGVNILGEDQEVLCHRFAVSGGEKFRDVDWHVGTGGTPVIEGVLAWVECVVESVHDAGDHELVVGRAMDLGVGTGAPLVFYRGGFADVRARPVRGVEDGAGLPGGGAKG